MDRRPSSRLRSATTALPPLSLIAIVISVGYLGWRLAATAGGAQPVTFVLLFAAEAFGVARLVSELVSVGRPVGPTVSSGALRSPAGASPGASLPSPTSAATTTGAPASTVIVIVDDEALPVVRAALIAARAMDGTVGVAVVDLHGRVSVRRLADRLGATHHRVAAGATIAERAAALTACATGVARTVATPAVVVVHADHVLLPDAARVLRARVRQGTLDAVTGRVDEANTVRPIDRTGLGDNELWNRHIARRLSDAGALTDWRGVVLVRRGALAGIGGFASTDGRTLTHTAAVLHAAGHHTALVDHEVARRLAPGPRLLGRHRYCRDLDSRLRRLRHSPRPPITTLAGLAAWSAVINPGRAIQRMVLLVVAWTVLLGRGSPVGASFTTIATAVGVRHLAAVLARRAAAGDAFEPWIVNDLRVLACDLAIGTRAFSRQWRPPLLSSRPPGSGPASIVVRGAQAVTAGLVLAVATGFVRIGHDGGDAAMALLGCTWFLSAGMVARRSVERRQFRRTFRTDHELTVLDDESIVVIGMSPTGFDVLADRDLHPGDALRALVALPTPSRGPVPVELVGTIRRTGRVGDRHAAYVAFGTLDDGVEDTIVEYLAVSSYRSIGPVAAPALGGTTQSA